MSSDENEKTARILTAEDLMAVVTPYHRAIARLGSSVISLASALRASEDPFVKKNADEAWQRLEEFIEQMEKGAAILDGLTKQGVERE